MNLKKLPKVELHLHLDGSVDIDIAKKFTNKTKNELINEIQVDYINQCFMGDKLDVYVKEIENTYFLIGKVEMTPIFSLKITLNRLNG